MEYHAEPGWRAELDGPIGEWFGKIARDIRDDAKAISPVDTGALRASIRAEVGDTTAVIGSDLDYSVWVEEGHRVAYRGRDGMVHSTGSVVPPQAYLRPALYRAR